MRAVRVTSPGALRVTDISMSSARLILAACGLLLAPGIVQAGPLADADRLYRSGRYEEAARQLTELALERPTEPSLYERLGAARYRAGDFEGAGRAWDQADRLRGGTDADSLYNSGNAHYRAGRLEEALARYDRALELAPNHDRARQNKELLVQELERRLQEEEPPPPGEGGDEENEDPSEGDQEGEQGGGQGGQDAESQSGEQDEPSDGDASPSGSGGEGEPEDEGEGQADLGELDPSEESGEPDPSGADASSNLGDSGPITAGEAHRMLDGVEEGGHRVRINGRGAGKPW